MNRRIAALLMLAICTGSVPSLRAQSPDGQSPIVIRVLDNATRQPLVNAQAIDLANQQTSFTNARGEATLSFHDDGLLRLRVREIGFQFADREIKRVSATRSDTVVVMLDAVAYQLPTVKTAAVTSCDPNPDPSAKNLSAIALSQLRLGAERYESFRRAYPFRVWIEHRVTEPDAFGEMQTESVQLPPTESDHWGHPYVPGHVLSEDANGGFLVPILFVSALADPVFWNHHCFVARDIESLGDARVVRLDFTPTKNTKTPDWAGSAYVDSATSMLRRVDFNLTGLGRHDVVQAMVGYTTFSSPAAFITVPDSTTAMWWRQAPIREGNLGPADGVESVHVQRLSYRKAIPAATTH